MKIEIHLVLNLFTLASTALLREREREKMLFAVMELAARIMKFHDFVKVSTFDDFILFSVCFFFSIPFSFSVSIDSDEKVNWKMQCNDVECIRSSFEAVKAIAVYR